MQPPEPHHDAVEASDLTVSPSFTDLPPGAVHLIFSFLGPRELCVASAVCKCWRDLNRDAAANKVWRELYAKRWRAPQLDSGSLWQSQYSKKMRTAQAYSSKGLADVLYGHTAPVYCVSLLPSANLLATGSADKTMRLWDLQAGLPLSISRPLKGPIRASAIDENMLVCGGSHDGALRLWRAKASLGQTKFDLQAPIRLSGHTGPVVSLALDQRNIYSASWDCSVRIWNRASLRRDSLLAFPDWVNSAKPRGNNLLVTAGRVLHVNSLETGQCISKYLHSPLEGALQWEEGMTTAPLQVDGSHDGRMAYLAGADGAVIAVDLRASKQPAALLWNQNSPVRDLRFEDPWLVAASYAGAVLLVDVDAVIREGSSAGVSKSFQPRGKGHPQSKSRLAKKRSMRQRLTGPSGPVFGVDIADNWLACGAADPVVRTWDFQLAEKETPRSATAPRPLRGSRRQRNRFPFAEGGSSDESSCLEDEPARPLSIPLSHSLPSHLGGRNCLGSGQSALEAGDTTSPNAGSQNYRDAGNSNLLFHSQPGSSQWSDKDAATHTQCLKQAPGRFSVSVPLPVRQRGGQSGETENSMKEWQLWQASREQGRLYREAIKVRS